MRPFLGIVLLLLLSAPTQAALLGTLPSTYCDMKEGAPISEKCAGFISGVMEAELQNDIATEISREMKKERLPVKRTICIPQRVSTVEAISRIVAVMRRRGQACGGVCPAALFVIDAMTEVYPCG